METTVRAFISSRLIDILIFNNTKAKDLEKKMGTLTDLSSGAQIFILCPDKNVWCCWSYPTSSPKYSIYIFLYDILKTVTISYLSQSLKKLFLKYIYFHHEKCLISIHTLQMISFHIFVLVLLLLLFLL